MPRNPPKPKLHGKQSDDYADWYRELDKWHSELEQLSRRNNVTMKIQRRKNLKASKDPRIVAKNERNRTTPAFRPKRVKMSKPSKSQFFSKPRLKVESTVNALTEMDMRGELVDSDKGVIRGRNRWATPRPIPESSKPKKRQNV